MRDSLLRRSHRLFRSRHRLRKLFCRQLTLEALEQRAMMDASVLYRINAGGSLLSSTPNWTADTDIAPSVYSNLAAADLQIALITRNIDLTHPSIPANTPQALFQSERWDENRLAEMQWEFPVTPGNFEVSLYFAETYDETQGIGKRIFDVSIENALVLDNFDIFAEVGGFKGIVKKFTVTADSFIDIDFARMVENPQINAIEIKTVVPVVTNDPPVIAPITNRNMAAGTVLSVDVSATDPNGNAIVLTASNLPSFANFVDNGNGTGVVTISPNNGNVGSYTLTMTATDNGVPSLSATRSFTVVVDPSSTGVVVYRVNAGGALVSATPNWTADSDSAPSTYSNRLAANLLTTFVTSNIDLTHPSIPANTPQALFQTERWDGEQLAEMQWEFPVSPGSYEVSLYFAETYLETQAIGKRVFDVSIENSIVLDNFDIFAEVGGFKGIVKKFTVTADSNIDVDFARMVENPTINAIEIKFMGAGTINQAPVIAPIGNKTLLAGTRIAFDVNASDVNGNAISLSANNLPSFMTFVDSGNGKGKFTVAPNEIHVGSYSLSVTATDNGSPSLSQTSSFTVVVRPSTAPAETVLYRVNAGGEAISSNPSWAGDPWYSPSPFSNALQAGSNTLFLGALIDNTDPSLPVGTPLEIFQSERWDSPVGTEMQWNFPVSPGRYLVRLYFAETYAQNLRDGARVFDVAIENSIVLNDYDIFTDVGGRAVAKSFLVTADSNIDIDFARVVENPSVRAIEILTASTLPNLLSASASSLQFVPTPTGSVAQQTITLTNLGSIGSPAIVVDSTSIVGVGSASFQDSFDNTTRVTIAPGASINLTVNFLPTSVGSKSASLEIAHSGSNSSMVVPLSGQAINETGSSKALFSITPTADGINASTFESSSFKISNNSTGGERITKLRIDLSTSILRDMVFDPFGLAGDTASKGFTVDSDPGTGFSGFNYANPHDGGFDVLEVSFGNFTNGKSFEFSIDVDPTSIRGQVGSHPSGSVSGLELVGAFVAVTFSDGITRTIKPYRQPGSINGSQNILRSNPPAPPVISIAGLTSNPASVSKSVQSVRVTGSPGASVALLVAEGTYLSAGLTNGGFDVDPFEAHSLVDVREYFATIGPNGTVDVQVTLSQSSPAAGVHSIVAGIKEFDGRIGVLSNAMVVKLLNSLPIGFHKSTLAGSNLASPTSLQFGPDGRLYIAQQDGTIQVQTIDRISSSSYQVRSTETINLISAIPNRDDNGVINASVQGRLITGLLVVGTATNPVIYVSSSDPRIGGGAEASDLNLDTNSGIISRLTWTGTQWNKLDLVRGLPRSEENHSTNGLVLDSATNRLLVAQGGNTNMGAPSNNFAFLPEYALSAAILSVDLNAIGSTTYNLPTLDDEDRPGVNDANDPFGGNNGKNQAKLVPGGPVQIYSPGYRNPYDLVITQAGRLYTIDNGPNAGWGNIPVNEGPAGLATNQINEPGVTYGDALHFVSSPGYYGGHPNPTRSNPNNKFNTSNPQSPVSVARPIESDYQIPGVDNFPLVIYPNSTTGIAEYTASNFGGALKGDLLSTSSSGTLNRVKLNGSGNAATLSNTLFNSVGIVPLDVTSQGDGAIFPGTIWCVDYITGDVIVFEPNDFNGAAGGGGTPNDLDGDGYSNSDEAANGTDPQNAGDFPPDWDTDFVSNLLDNDDDNDSLLDTLDPFAIDPNNGLLTPVGTSYSWENNAPNANGLLRLGFTGLMTNGTSNYASLFDATKLTAGGAAGVLTIDEVNAGTATGSTNTQQQAFQFGVKTSDVIDPFSAHTRILAPFAGIVPQGAQSMGLFVGTGDQNNFVRIWVTANNGAPAINVASEINGVLTNGTTSLLVLPLQASIDLYLTIDPVSNTVQPSYAVTDNGNTGARILVGAAIAIPSSWRTNAARGMAVGIISTTAGTAPKFSATWDFLSVTDDGFAGLASASLLVGNDPTPTTSVPAVELGAASNPEPTLVPKALNRYDVNQDGAVSPVDVLIVINELTRNGRNANSADGELSQRPSPADVDGSGSIEPIDVLQVINYLRRQTNVGGAEGESAVPAVSQPTTISSSLSWGREPLHRIPKKELNQAPVAAASTQRDDIVLTNDGQGKAATPAVEEDKRGNLSDFVFQGSLKDILGN